MMWAVWALGCATGAFGTAWTLSMARLLAVVKTKAKEVER